MWRDNLTFEGKGSFRSREFFVDVAESEVGRRTVLHEFPGRDTPFVEDVGRAPRRFHLTCYVLGPSYDVDRDLLRDEFEKEGPGQLVHPYWGQLTVQVVSTIRIRETPSEGGMARFDLDVVEIAGAQLTVALPDLAPIVSLSAIAALAASASSFTSLYSIRSAIGSVRALAVSTVGTLTSKLKEVRGTMNAALSVIDDTAGAIANLSSAAAQLVTAPAELVSSIQGVIGSVMGAISKLDAATAALLAEGAGLLSASDGRLAGDFRASRALEAVRKLSSNGDDLSPVANSGSSQDAIAATNQMALVQVYQVAGAVEGARALVDLDYGSRDVVEAARDEVVATLEALGEDAPDELWAALADLRHVFHQRMSEIAAKLPQILEHVPAETRPALVIAYDVHGDARREREIVLRNGIRDPNFVPGLVPLQVIADG